MDSKLPHILNTSSNLLGFTFLILSSIKALGFSQGTIIDEMASLGILLFAVSSLTSFISMRLKSKERGQRMEILAEYVFMFGLMLLTVLALLLAFDFVTLGR